jgi:hypothetical protein
MTIPPSGAPRRRSPKRVVRRRLPMRYLPPVPFLVPLAPKRAR